MFLLQAYFEHANYYSQRVSVVILGLGSNIGDRFAYLCAAIAKIAPLLDGMVCSRVFESKALPCQGEHPAVDRPFYNMAIRGETLLSPLVLLEAIKGVERDLGRVHRFVWGPREIDIDILAMDGVIFEETVLHIPHPELIKRDFALIPLNDVAPEWEYPVAGAFFGKIPADIITAMGYVVGDDLCDMELIFHV